MIDRLVAIITRIPKVRVVVFYLFLSWPSYGSRFSVWRATWYRPHMKHLGTGSKISHDVKMHDYHKISIGSNTHITNSCILDGRGTLTIGDDVLIGYQSVVMTHARGYQDRDVLIREQKGFTKPVVIEDDVWLGARVTVLPGVTIHQGAVVATGAIVTKDVPAYAVVAGVPAKILHYRGEGKADLINV